MYLSWTANHRMTIGLEVCIMILATTVSSFLIPQAISPSSLTSSDIMSQQPLLKTQVPRCYALDVAGSGYPCPGG